MTLVVFVSRLNQHAARDQAIPGYFNASPCGAHRHPENIPAGAMSTFISADGLTTPFSSNLVTIVGLRAARFHPRRFEQRCAGSPTGVLA